MRWMIENLYSARYLDNPNILYQPDWQEKIMEDRGIQWTVEHMRNAIAKKLAEVIPSTKYLFYISNLLIERHSQENDIIICLAMAIDIVELIDPSTARLFKPLPLISIAKSRTTYNFTTIMKTSCEACGHEYGDNKYQVCPVCKSETHFVN